MRNFGRIKNIFNDIFIESVLRKDKKKRDVFKKYINAIKENKILRAQYSLYTNIENKVESNEFKASEYIKENISLMNIYSTKEIESANIELLKLAGNIKESKLTENYDLSPLHESICNLITTKKNVTTIDIRLESTSDLVKYIQENKSNVDVIRPTPMHTGILTKLIVDKFNEKYSDISESEKKILKAIFESNLEAKQSIFIDTKNECVSLVDSLINESDDDTKNKLVKVKDKVLAMEYIEESFINDIEKIINLTSDLKEI
jgi:hypothetical protein